MSKNISCEIDTTKIESLLSELSDDIHNEILMKGLKKGGDKLKENTQQIMLQKVPFAGYAKGYANKTMVEGVRVIKDRDYNEIIVSIMKNYLNIFFENGTTERYRKLRGVKPNGKTYRKDNTQNGYTGKVEGYHFFKEARENDSDVIEAIKETIINEINKVYNK